MRIDLKPVERTCGPCTLCCKVLRIPELEKPQNAWCRHAKKGRGCGIYEARPESCRSFSCLWLDGLAPEWARPDLVHGVMTATTDGAQLVLHEDPGFRGAAREKLKEVIDRFVADGKHYVAVVSGDRRTLIATPELLNDSKFEQLLDGTYRVTTQEETPHDARP